MRLRRGQNGNQSFRSGGRSSRVREQRFGSQLKGAVSKGGISGWRAEMEGTLIKNTEIFMFVVANVLIA